MTEHALKPSHSPLLMPPSASASLDALGLRVEIRPGVPAVAEVSGDIDIATAPWLRETLLLAIQRYGPAIDVDLHGVTFLDCAGVNALLATARRARLEGGQVRVTRLSAPARRVISLLGLQDHYELARDHRRPRRESAGQRWSRHLRRPVTPG